MPARPVPVRDAGNDLASVAWSLAAHVLLVAVMVLGGMSFWRSSPPPTLGIEAVVVDPRTLQRATRPKPPAPTPPPATPPRPAEPPPDLRAEAERERLAAEARERDRQQAAEQKKAEQKKAEQQAARAAEAKAQAERVAAERAAAEKAAAKAAAEKAEAARRDAEKAKAAKAEADKAAAAKAAAQRAEDARRRAAADLARQLAEEEQLASAVSSGALAEYIDLIRQKVERNWVPPGSARPGLECEVIVNQLPGGQVGDVRIGRCNGDDAVRRSIEAAVRRSDPLPLPADPALFERNLRFTFKPEE